jgi:SAGA-associated factor 29
LKKSPDNAMSQGNVATQLRHVDPNRDSELDDWSEKRAKRSGIATPTSQGRTPGTTPPPQLTVSLPAPMRSAAQQSAGFSREPKARREALADQLPLKPGRKVAFRPVSKKGVVGPDGKKEDGEEWIMASVKRCINQDKNR